jgi:hypothetical protein
VHEVRALKDGILGAFSFAKGAFVVFDRGYNDYSLFAHWMREGVYFVTRMKSNAHYRVLKRLHVRSAGPILCDQLIQLTSPKAKRECSGLLRRIEVYDAENDKIIVLLTNHLEFASSTIAKVYKDRWEIEIFFQDHQTATENQNVRRNQSQCRAHSTLDSAHCDSVAEILEDALDVRALVSLESQRSLTVQFVLVS